MNDPKKKPDAGGAAPGEDDGHIASCATDTLPDTPAVVQDADDPIVRTTRLASHYARKEGHLGTYTDHRPKGDHEPEIELWWVAREKSERVAFSLPDGTILMVGDEIYSHRPLIEAGDEILGDDFQALEVAQ